MDDTVKSPDDLTQFEELKLLGTIGRIKGKNYPDKIVTHLEPFSGTAESYRMIRNKIRFGLPSNQAISILVTSPEPGEGKSITAANLGIIMAQSNQKTILVDADLAHPVLHRVFDVKNKPGLADLLSAPETDIGWLLKSTMINNLRIITSGELSQDLSQRLDSERFSNILEKLFGEANVVIIDSPPAMLAADAAVLSHKASGVILVIRAGKSKQKTIRQTLIDLNAANATVLGYVFNQLQKDNHLAVYKGYPEQRNPIQHVKAIFNRGPGQGKKKGMPLAAPRSKGTLHRLRKRS
jgi:capsular exopolysaccharide synthesis family protein